MDELTAELAAAAWFESVRIHVISASDLTDERQFGPGSLILTTVHERRNSSAKSRSAARHP